MFACVCEYTSASASAPQSMSVCAYLDFVKIDAIIKDKRFFLSFLEKERRKW